MNTPEDVGTTEPADPGQTYTDPISVATVTLSYFAPPASAEPAPGLDKAYRRRRPQRRRDRQPRHTAYVVAGTFYFVVPADVTAATLRVGAYPG